MGINKGFNKFIKDNITLYQDDICEKASSREWVIDKVIAKIKEKDNCPQLYKENGSNYLGFGSYFKGTKVSKVDEFDIMLIVDSKGGIFSVGGTEVGEGDGIISPNPKYNGNYHKNDESGISPRKLMNWLKVVIDEALEPYGCESCEKDGQAVTVYMKKKDYCIDFVPGGIFKEINSEDIFYIIPKGDADGGWIRTNPKVDKQIINSVSSNYTQFKNTIRLFKYIFKNSYDVKIGSYAVESSIVDYEKKFKFYDDFEHDFIGILNHIMTLVKDENIPDMRDNDINLLGYINKKATLDKLNRIKTKFEQLDEESELFSVEVEAFLKNE